VDQLVTLKISDLKPYEKNARKHEAADVAAIAKSIEAFGFNDPVGVWGPQNIIVEGHGRVLAAKQLGLTEVPCIRLDSLTDEQRRAYALAHNKTAELSVWDPNLLPAEIKEIRSYDMAAFGFIPPAEIGVEDHFTDPDLLPEDENAEPITRRGDIYILGDHKLICGDSTDPEDLQKLMGDELADLWVTDPPYNVAYEGGTEEHLRILNDNMDSARFLEFLTDAFTSAAEYIKPGGAFYIWHADTEGLNFRTALIRSGLTLRECLVWVKSSLVLGRQDYHWQHEPCLYGWKDGASHYFVDDRTQTTVYEDARPNIAKMTKDEMRRLLEDIYSDKTSTTVIHEDKPSRSEAHPTMKPVRLIARSLRNSSRPGEIVLDTFGGSGTTMIACEQLHRKCRMVELDPHYCDVIVKRWENLTGRTAVLERA